MGLIRNVPRFSFCVRNRQNTNVTLTGILTFWKTTYGLVLISSLQSLSLDGTSAQPFVAVAGDARLLAVALLSNCAPETEGRCSPVLPGARMPASHSLPRGFGHRRPARHAGRNGGVSEQEKHLPGCRRQAKLLEMAGPARRLSFRFCLVWIQ